MFSAKSDWFHQKPASILISGFIEAASNVHEFNLIKMHVNHQQSKIRYRIFLENLFSKSSKCMAYFEFWKQDCVCLSMGLSPLKIYVSMLKSKASFGCAQDGQISENEEKATQMVFICLEDTKLKKKIMVTKKKEDTRLYPKTR